MKTTYSVNWQVGEEEAVAGSLEVRPDAVVFTPARDGEVAEVPFEDIPAVRRHASTVEVERRTGAPIRIESAGACVLGPSLKAGVGAAETLHAVRTEHDRIERELGELRTVVDALPELTAEQGDEVRLLTTDLMRRIVSHAHVEEQELYPVVGRLFDCGPLVEAMIFDHRAIEGEICDLVRIDRDDCARFACVFHRLDALLMTHIAKEEAILFPLLDSR